LKRVLRIRALREDLSRMEVEAEAARLREIDLGAAEAARAARASREQAFREMQGRELPGEAAEGVSEGTEEVATSEQAGSGSGDGRESGNPVNGRTEEGWRRAEAAWETAVWRRSGLEQRRPAQQGRVDRAQAVFLADRRDRLQAETLVEEAAARDRADQARRDQRGLDDWFQSRAKRGRNEEER
jgi:hypothetical protein